MQTESLEQRILRLEALSLELIKGLEATSSALREVLSLTTLQQKSNAETQTSKGINASRSRTGNKKTMKVMLLPRRAGKTSRLIEWLEEDQCRLMVVIHLREQNRLAQLYPKLARQIITWESYKGGRHLLGHPIKEIVIDNLDLILEEICAHKIAAVSFTGFSFEKSPIKTKLTNN